MASSVFLGNLLHETTAILTDANIKALATTPFVLVPPTQTLGYSGVPSTLPTPVFATGVLNTVGGAYTNVASTTALLLANGTDWSDDASTRNLVEQKLNVQAVSLLRFLMPRFTINGADDKIFIDNTYLTDNYEDNALVLALSNSGDLTGGHASNTLRLTVQYYILDTTTGLYV
jgi:hypothetical protein